MKNHSTNCLPKPAIQCSKSFSELGNSISSLERMSMSISIMKHFMELISLLELSLDDDLAVRISSVWDQIFKINQSTQTLLIDIENALLRAQEIYSLNATKSAQKTG